RDGVRLRHRTSGGDADRDSAMAYFAAEAPHLERALELIDAQVLPAQHPLQPMLAATSVFAKVQLGWADGQLPPLPGLVLQIRPDSLGATVGNLPAHSAFLHLFIGQAEEALAQCRRM